MTNNETFSRVLIDKALESSGWNLLDPRQVAFELQISSGRADYCLKDQVGRVLCVLEAKREDLDPYDAKEQAARSARCESQSEASRRDRRSHPLGSGPPLRGRTISGGAGRAVALRRERRLRAKRRARSRAPAARSSCMPCSRA